MKEHTVDESILFLTWPKQQTATVLQGPQRGGTCS